MKNSDKPINAVFNEWGQVSQTEHPDFDNGNSKFLLGLSKREYFAGLAMQSFINNVHSDAFIAEQSVKIADKLLEQLEITATEL